MIDVGSADARLVAADPAITGMAEVLAPLGLVQRLAPHWDVVAARVSYLRYKPGTSLVAGLVLTDSAGATSAAQALALGPGAPAKLAKVALAGEADDVGRGAVVDERAGVALSDVTADRHLPGVRRVLRRVPTVTQLVYKPGRRWVAREDHDGQAPLLVKAHRNGALRELLAGYRALQGLPVAGVVKVRERHGTITHPWVPGRPLDQVVDATAPGLWDRAGALLAQLHHRPLVDDLARVDRDTQLAAAVAAVRAVLPPDLTAEARATAERVRAGLAGRTVTRVVHGDFSADQVIVRPDLAALDVAAATEQPELTIVDLDRVGVDDPLADLASWYGALVAAADAAGDPVDVLDPLLSGYHAAGGVADPELLRLHCAAAVLQRATEPFRRHLPDWPERAARLVGTARELAS